MHSELGSAPAIARAIDQAAHERVVGTLAGDDTCLVITRDEKDARALAAELGDAMRLELEGAGRAHGRASSSCAASRMSVASANGAPIICTPIGSPSSLQWSGTDIAGWPVTLTIAVNGVQCHCRANATCGSPSAPSQAQPIGTGGSASVGVRTTSTSLQNATIAASALAAASTAAADSGLAVRARSRRASG